MTLQALYAKLKETGMPVTYRLFKKGEVPALPYLVYYVNGSDDFYADDKNYMKAKEMTVELYSGKKDIKAEEAVETCFLKAGIPYKSSELWIADEGVFEVIYEFKI